MVSSVIEFCTEVDYLHIYTSKFHYFLYICKQKKRPIKIKIDNGLQKLTKKKYISGGFNYN